MYVHTHVYVYTHEKTLLVGHVHVLMFCYRVTEDDMKVLEQNFLDGKYHPFSSNESPLSLSLSWTPTHTPPSTQNWTASPWSWSDSPPSTGPCKPPPKKRRKTGGKCILQLYGHLYNVYTAVVSAPPHHERWSLVKVGVLMCALIGVHFCTCAVYMYM